MTRFDELKAASQLPSPTGVALAILRLTETDNTATEAISRVLQTDPALSGRVLKLANSTALGRSRPVTAIRDAVAQLGTHMMRNVALSFSLISQTGQGACREFDYQSFWSRSLAHGVAAQAGATLTGQIAATEAFTCGLLARVGCLALATIYPDAYAQVLIQSKGGSPGDLCRLEREHFATDHNEMTAALLRDWGLPDLCIDAAQHHEQPDESGFLEDSRTQILMRLLHLTGQLADVCVAADNLRPTLVQQLFASGDILGISSLDLISLCDRVVAEWQEWGKNLAVATQAVPRFADLREQARQRADVAAKAPDVLTQEQWNALESPVFQSSNAEGAGLEPAQVILKVVVIDDDPTERRIIGLHLTAAGHTVQSASDGVEGLRLILDSNPQLVITDWMMPHMDGMALCKALRQTKLGRQLYLIMLTGTGEDENQVEAFEAGADDYLIKPLRPRILAARLRACQRLLRLQEEVRRDKEELRRCLAELSVANRKLQQAALTDPLSGLYNRRYALDRLEQEWSAAQRSQRVLSCMIIDIDHFKRINDTYGHDVGDRVFCELTGVLLATVRRNDVICRLGGDEFLIVSPATDQEEAWVVAERLRDTVQQHVVTIPGNNLHLTLSIGLAVSSPWMSSPADLLKAADRAVYAAKQSGRNQVCVSCEFGLQVAN
jgi:diguanylate cyclase (GGDEF)-like protein